MSFLTCAEKSTKIFCLCPKYLKNCFIFLQKPPTFSFIIIEFLLHWATYLFKFITFGHVSWSKKKKNYKNIYISNWRNSLLRSYYCYSNVASRISNLLIWSLLMCASYNLIINWHRNWILTWGLLKTLWSYKCFKQKH